MISLCGLNKCLKWIYEVRGITIYIVMYLYAICIRTHFNILWLIVVVLSLKRLIMYAILSECVCANCAWAFNAFFSFCLFSFFLSAFFTLHSALTRNLTQINENNKNDSQNNNNFNQCVRLRVSVCLSMFLWINALHNLQASVSLCSTYAHRTQGFSI